MGLCYEFEEQSLNGELIRNGSTTTISTPKDPLVQRARQNLLGQRRGYIYNWDPGKPYQHEAIFITITNRLLNNIQQHLWNLPPGQGHTETLHVLGLPECNHSGPVPHHHLHT